MSLLKMNLIWWVGEYASCCIQSTLSLNPHNHKWGGTHSYIHLTDEKAEAWRDPAGSARSHWQWSPAFLTGSPSKAPGTYWIPMMLAQARCVPFLQKAPRTLLDFQTWGGLSLSHSLSPPYHTASSTFTASTDRQNQEGGTCFWSKAQCSG